MPIVESIKWDTLEHRPYANGGISNVGVWEWGFLYKEMSISQDELNAKPLKTLPNRYEFVGL